MPLPTKAECFFLQIACQGLVVKLIARHFNALIIADVQDVPVPPYSSFITRPKKNLIFSLGKGFLSMWGCPGWPCPRPGVLCTLHGGLGHGDPPTDVLLTWSSTP